MVPRLREGLEQGRDSLEIRPRAEIGECSLRGFKLESGIFVIAGALVGLCQECPCTTRVVRETDPVEE